MVQLEGLDGLLLLVSTSAVASLSARGLYCANRRTLGKVTVLAGQAFLLLIGGHCL